MKLKEFDWINKPKDIKITSSRKLSYKSTDYHAFIYTFDDNKTIQFKIKADCENGLELFLSPGYGIIFKLEDNKIVKETKLFDQKSYDYYSINTNNIVWKIEKSNDCLFFYFDDTLLTSFTFPSLKGSVSIGPFTNGAGLAEIEFEKM